MFNSWATIALLIIGALVVWTLLVWAMVNLGLWLGTVGVPN